MPPATAPADALWVPAALTGDLAPYAGPHVQLAVSCLVGNDVGLSAGVVCVTCAGVEVFKEGTKDVLRRVALEDIDAVTIGGKRVAIKHIAEPELRLVLPTLPTHLPKSLPHLLKELHAHRCGGDAAGAGLDVADLGEDDVDFSQPSPPAAAAGAARAVVNAGCRCLPPPPQQNNTSTNNASNAPGGVPLQPSASALSQDAAQPLHLGGVKRAVSTEASGTGLTRPRAPSAAQVATPAASMGGASTGTLRRDDSSVGAARASQQQSGGGSASDQAALPSALRGSASANAASQGDRDRGDISQHLQHMASPQRPSPQTQQGGAVVSSPPHHVLSPHTAPLGYGPPQPTRFGQGAVYDTGGQPAAHGAGVASSLLVSGPARGGAAASLSPSPAPRHQHALVYGGGNSMSRAAQGYGLLGGGGGVGPSLFSAGVGGGGGGGGLLGGRSTSSAGGGAGVGVSPAVLENLQLRVQQEVAAHQQQVAGLKKTIAQLKRELNAAREEVAEATAAAAAAAPHLQPLPAPAATRTASIEPPPPPPPPPPADLSVFEPTEEFWVGDDNAATAAAVDWKPDAQISSQRGAARHTVVQGMRRLRSLGVDVDAAGFSDAEEPAGSRSSATPKSDAGGDDDDDDDDRVLVPVWVLQGLRATALAKERAFDELKDIQQKHADAMEAARRDPSGGSLGVPYHDPLGGGCSFDASGETLLSIARHPGRRQGPAPGAGIRVHVSPARRPATAAHVLGYAEGGDPPPPAMVDACVGTTGIELAKLRKSMGVSTDRGTLVCPMTAHKSTTTAASAFQETETATLGVQTNDLYKRHQCVGTDVWAGAQPAAAAATPPRFERAQAAPRYRGSGEEAGDGISPRGGLVHPSTAAIAAAAVAAAARGSPPNDVASPLRVDGAATTIPSPRFSHARPASRQTSSADAGRFDLDTTTVPGTVGTAAAVATGTPAAVGDIPTTALVLPTDAELGEAHLRAPPSADLASFTRPGVAAGGGNPRAYGGGEQQQQQQSPPHIGGAGDDPAGRLVARILGRHDPLAAGGSVTVDALRALQAGPRPRGSDHGRGSAPTTATQGTQATPPATAHTPEYSTAHPAVRQETASPPSFAAPPEVASQPQPSNDVPTTLGTGPLYLGTPEHAPALPAPDRTTAPGDSEGLEFQPIRTVDSVVVPRRGGGDANTVFSLSMSAPTSAAASPPLAGGGGAAAQRGQAPPTTRSPDFLATRYGVAAAGGTPPDTYPSAAAVAWETVSPGRPRLPSAFPGLPSVPSMGREAGDAAADGTTATPATVAGGFGGGPLPNPHVAHTVVGAEADTDVAPGGAAAAVSPTAAPAASDPPPPTWLPETEVSERERTLSAYARVAPPQRTLSDYHSPPWGAGGGVVPSFTSSDFNVAAAVDAAITTTSPPPIEDEGDREEAGARGRRMSSFASDAVGLELEVPSAAGAAVVFPRHPLGSVSPEQQQQHHLQHCPRGDPSGRGGGGGGGGAVSSTSPPPTQPPPQQQPQYQRPSHPVIVSLDEFYPVEDTPDRGAGGGGGGGGATPHRPNYGFAGASPKPLPPPPPAQRGYGGHGYGHRQGYGHGSSTAGGDHDYTPASGAGYGTRQPQQTPVYHAPPSQAAAGTPMGGGDVLRNAEGISRMSTIDHVGQAEQLLAEMRRMGSGSGSGGAGGGGGPPASTLGRRRTSSTSTASWGTGAGTGMGGVRARSARKEKKEHDRERNRDRRGSTTTRRPERRGSAGVSGSGVDALLDQASALYDRTCGMQAGAPGGRPQRVGRSGVPL